jgi:3-oxoacyl-[acyl-carrier protein] reductase
MGESLLDILGEGWERRNTLTGRVVDPEEVADAVKFLIRNDSITGEVLTLDGGTTLVGRLTRGERP